MGRKRGPDRLQGKDGYIELWMPEHPRSRKGRVREHIVVLESKLGRRLESNEECHHINGIKNDNRDDNLIVKFKPNHTGGHSSGNHYRHDYYEINKANAVTCPCGSKVNARGLCSTHYSRWRRWWIRKIKEGTWD